MKKSLKELRTKVTYCDLCDERVSDGVEIETYFTDEYGYVTVRICLVCAEEIVDLLSGEKL